MLLNPSKCINRDETLATICARKLERHKKVLSSFFWCIWIHQNVSTEMKPLPQSVQENWNDIKESFQVAFWCFWIHENASRVSLPLDSWDSNLWDLDSWIRDSNPKEWIRESQNSLSKGPKFAIEFFKYLTFYEISNV